MFSAPRGLLHPSIWQRLQNEPQNWPRMGRPPPRAVLELGEVGRCRGGPVSGALKSFWLPGRGADTEDSVFPSEGRFPREHVGLTPRLCFSLGSSRVRRTSGQSPVGGTTRTLRARRRLSLHAAWPLPHLAPPPTCADFPKLLSGGRERLPSPKGFTDTWQSVVRTSSQADVSWSDPSWWRSSRLRADLTASTCLCVWGGNVHIG